MAERRFPPPWSVEDIGAAFVVLLRRRLNFLEMVMGKAAFALAIAISMLPSTGHAQEREDMTQVTCTNYLIMAPDMARTFFRLDERLVQSKIRSHYG